MVFLIVISSFSVQKVRYLYWLVLLYLCTVTTLQIAWLQSAGLFPFHTSLYTAEGQFLVGRGP